MTSLLLKDGDFFDVSIVGLKEGHILSPIFDNPGIYKIKLVKHLHIPIMSLDK